MHPEVEHLKDLSRAVGITGDPEAPSVVEVPAEPARDEPAQAYEHLSTARRLPPTSAFHRISGTSS